MAISIDFLKRLDPDYVTVIEDVTNVDLYDYPRRIVCTRLNAEPMTFASVRTIVLAKFESVEATVERVQIGHGALDVGCPAARIDYSLRYSGKPVSIVIVRDTAYCPL